MRFLISEEMENLKQSRVIKDFSIKEKSKVTFSVVAVEELLSPNIFPRKMKGEKNT